MIHRTPTPKKHFVILRNAVVRDKRLSYRATGLLVELLSRPNNWVIDAKRLAAGRPDGEGVTAILTALNELEAAGYIRRQRTRAQGKFCWVQDIYDVTSGTVDEEAESVQVAPTNGLPVSGFLTHGNLASLEEPRRRTDIEVQDLKTCGTDIARSAPAVGGDDSSTQQRDQTMTAEEADERRQEDREIFAQLVGEHVYYYGKDYQKGKYRSSVFYDDFRRKEIHWPGAYLAHLEERVPDCGLEDWLFSRDLERADT